MGYRVLTKDDLNELAPAAALKALSRRVAKLEKAERERQEAAAPEPELKPAEPQPAPEAETEGTEPEAEAAEAPEADTLPLDEDGQQ